MKKDSRFYQIYTYLLMYNSYTLLHLTCTYYGNAIVLVKL